MISKDERKSIGISAVAAIVGMCAIVLPVGWWLVKPALAESLSEQLTTQMEQTVAKKIAPLNAGFKAVIQQNIDRLRREIATLENKARTAPLSDQEARELIDKRIELDGQLAAIAEIRAAETQ